MGIFDFLNFMKKKGAGHEGDYKSTLGLTQPDFDSRPAMPSPGMRPLEPLPVPARQPAQMTNEMAVQDNMKAKVDLLSTQVESMRIQNDSMNEKLIQIERMLKQILDMARSGRPF